jgi:hypothetical protein
MSPAERRRYDEAFRIGTAHLDFDPDTRLTGAEQAQLQQLLENFAATPRTVCPPSALTVAPSERRVSQGGRRLSDFELAGLRRALQSATSVASTPELLRQVAWSIEEGALRRFSPGHARHIALKKIREGAWTRPNRMPPNWARPLGMESAPETCGAA